MIGTAKEIAIEMLRDDDNDGEKFVFRSRLMRSTARRSTAKPRQNFAPRTVSGCHGTVTIFGFSPVSVS